MSNGKHFALWQIILIYDFKLPYGTPFSHLLYKKQPPVDLRKQELFEDSVIKAELLRMSLLAVEFCSMCCVEAVWQWSGCLVGHSMEQCGPHRKTSLFSFREKHLLGCSMLLRARSSLEDASKC